MPLPKAEIEQVWTNPILIDETGTILAGHGRWEAAKRLGRTEVPKHAGRWVDAPIAALAHRDGAVR